MQRLKVYKNGEDVSMLIEARNGRGGLHHSTYELWYVDAIGVEENIGYIFCGDPYLNSGFEKDYRLEVVEEE